MKFKTYGAFDFSLNICEVEADPRYDGNRVWGLKFSVPAGESPAAGPIARTRATSSLGLNGFTT